MTSEAGMTDGTGGEGPCRPMLCVLTLGNF